MISQESKKNARLRERRKNRVEDAQANIARRSVKDMLKKYPRIEDWPTFTLSQMKPYLKERNELNETGIEKLFFGYDYEIEHLKYEIKQLDSEIEALKDERKMLVSQLKSAQRDHELKYTEAEDIELRISTRIKVIPILLQFVKPGKKPEFPPHREHRIMIEDGIGTMIVDCINWMKLLKPGRPVIDSSDEENGLAYELALRLKEEDANKWKYEFIRKTWTARGDYGITS